MRSQAIRYFRMILQILHRYISLFSRTPTYTKEEKAEIVTTHHDGGVVIVRNDPNTLLCRLVPPRILLGPVQEFPPQVFYSALGFSFLPPQAIIPPQVFHFCQLLLPFHLLFCTPRFLIPPQVFHFCHPRLLFRPKIFSFSIPRLLFCPKFFTLTYPTRLLFRLRLLFSSKE